jgi:hypothetical protein
MDAKLRTITPEDRARIAAHGRSRQKAHDHVWSLQNPNYAFETHACCEVCGMSLPKAHLHAKGLL